MKTVRRLVSTLTTILALIALPAIWTGCSSTGASSGTASTPPEQKAAREGWDTVDIHMDPLVRLNNSVPVSATLGDTYPVELTVTAVEVAGDVTVTDRIPEGASFVRAEPEAKLDGKILTWRLGAMNRDEVRTLKFWLKAEQDGELCNCAAVHAIPRGCVKTLIGKAAVAIEKTGPATARVGDPVNYTVVVKNMGNATARDVVVTDNVPDGLGAEGGQKQLSYNVGVLAPSESKQVEVPLRAERRGKFTNVATVRSSNAGEATDNATTVVTQPGLSVTKTGTAEQFVGRTANYEIVVANTGDTSLTDVVVTDWVDPNVKILSASGAEINGFQATWRIPDLAASEKKNFEVSVTSMVSGNFPNNVSVVTREGLKEAARANTLWKGMAALLLQLSDDPDPIGVGETTTYNIRVTNQGTAESSNIKIVAKFDKEIDPVSASGATEASVSGKVVTFGTVARLAPKQAVSWTITGKGVQPGDHRVKVEMTSDILSAPVVQEESTHVY
ncbi:MAG: DUF11 domain-containing protein [Verrucomicrobiae bacterium]|nr:DUF11 domain-containing protein [Verrucomicrobiae bacterium]